MTNIYVGNLPFSISEDEVREMFTEFGSVDTVSLIMDRETGRPRGFGFVEMSDESAAQKAIEALNGKNMGGRDLTVNEAKSKGPRTGGGGGGGGGRGRGGYGGDRGGSRW